MGHRLGARRPAESLFRGGSRLFARRAGGPSGPLFFFAETAVIRRRNLSGREEESDSTCAVLAAIAACVASVGLLLLLADAPAGTFADVIDHLVTPIRSAGGPEHRQSAR